jgi:hypothetical protein
MTPDEKEAAIRKILALMAKTVESGCTEDEAMAASEAVTRLLAKYQLSLSDLELRDSKCIDGKQDTARKGIGPIDSVITAIGYLCDVKVWRAPGEGAFGGIVYHFFGLEHDVLVAEYIYKICDRAITFGWEYYKDDLTSYKIMTPTQKTKAKESYQYGMAHRLHERLRKMKDEQKREAKVSTGRDLVVVKDEIINRDFAQLGLNLRSTNANKSINSDSHYRAGQDAGDRVGFNKGVGSEQSWRLK